MNNRSVWEFKAARVLGVARISLTGVVEECNAAFAQILGRDRIGTIGKSVISDLTWVEDQEETRKRFQGLADGTIPNVSTMKRYRMPDDSSVFCHIEACLVRDPNSNDPLYIIDGMWELPKKHVPVQTVDPKIVADVRRLEELMLMMKRDAKDTTHINITQGNDMGQKVNTGGGDFAGQNMSKNSATTIKILAGALAVTALAVAYMIYYMAVVMNGGTPEPPKINPGQTPPAETIPAEQP